MIHHLSITAHNPQQVTQVLAEVLQGIAFPFPVAGFDGSYIAATLDAYGTVIDVHPFGTELIPKPEAAGFQLQQNPAASRYTATHAAVSVPVSEAEIRAIAAQVGWRCEHRTGAFEVIELWLENCVLVELLPPALAAKYVDFMAPQTLQKFIAEIQTINQQVYYAASIAT